MSTTFEHYFLSRMYINDDLKCYIKVSKENELYHAEILRRHKADKPSDDAYGTHHSVGRFDTFDAALGSGEAEAVRLHSVDWRQPWNEPCPTCGKLIQGHWSETNLHSRARPCK